MLTDEVLSIFTFLQNRSFLLVTIGNRFRMDDGVGPYIADQLKKESPEYPVINVENRPENIVTAVEELNNESIVIIDACKFGGRAGEARVIPIDLMPERTISTHRFPLKAVMKILENDLSDNLYFLGIQPQAEGMGDSLSQTVKDTADNIIKLFINCLQSGENDARI